MLFNDGGAYETSMGNWSRLVGEVFIKWLRAVGNLKWLDVGCGNGAFSGLIKTSCFPSQVDAIDPSAEQIDFARSQLITEKFQGTHPSDHFPLLVTLRLR